MLRLALSQMRRSVGRLAAAGLAVAIGAAFVAITLLAGDLIQRSALEQVSARYASADLVVGTPWPVGQVGVDAIARVDGVAAAAGVTRSGIMLQEGPRSIWQWTIGTVPDPRLTPLVLAEGRWPASEGEVALPAETAERLGTPLGDPITALRWTGLEGEEEQVEEPLTVVGILDDPRGAFASGGGMAVMEAAALADFLGLRPDSFVFDEVILTLEEGASIEQVRTRITQALAEGTRVQTPSEVASQQVAVMTGGQDIMFYVFVLTFAAIALIVAGLVIANTFQVLVAQRTKTLALLRAVGASRGQVGGSMILEALILGVTASGVGIVAGISLAQGALTLAGHHLDLGAPLPSSVRVSVPVVALPLMVGAVVTVLAALVPARAATRVAPLAALRQGDVVPAVKGRAGRVRLVLSLLMALLGAGLLGLGVLLGAVEQDAVLGLLAAVAGGAISFIGVALSAVFWLPWVTALAGRLAGLSGPTARLASANTLRNPRRTAATATALMIGVTLVAMMSVGAASARATINAQLDAHYPVDVALESMEFPADGSLTPVPLPNTLISAIAADRGVGAVATLSTALGGIEAAGFETVVPLLAAEPASAARVLNDPRAIDALEPGVIVIPEAIAGGQFVDGQTVSVSIHPHWHELSEGDISTPLRVVLSPGRGVNSAIITLDDWTALGGDPAPTMLWASLNALDAVGRIQDHVADAGVAIVVEGNAIERHSLEQIIDTILAVIVGLLAVAVVIALIGVANTLSLSVIERRGESATLRAIGVTRWQLRRMLAIEGMLIAGVGTLVGLALGTAYGLSGALAALGPMGQVHLAISGRDTALVALIALIAGVAASIGPARSAVRPSPVEALAEV